MATSPYQYFNEILNKWPTAIALESQWFCYFDISTVTAIQSNFNNLIKNFESGSQWNIPQSTISNLTNANNQSQTQNLIGCVFAREVSLPGESVKAANQGLDYGGYQAPVTSDGRSPYKNLTVVFHETNSSFIDFVIRPWIIAVGYYGLVTRANQNVNVKADIAQMIYLGKTGPKSPSIFRKAVNFYNIFPISFNGLRNTYATEGMQYTSVTFAYDYYSVVDPTGGTDPSSSKALPSSIPSSMSPKEAANIKSVNQQFSSYTSNGQTTYVSPSKYAGPLVSIPKAPDNAVLPR